MLDYNNYEIIRIGYALFYLSIFSYFDIKNDREIPDKVVYALSAIAYSFLLLFPINLALYGAIQAIAIFAITYIMYRVGQVGLAEAFSLSSLAALFPIEPTIAKTGLELPFIFFIFVFSGIVFSIFITLYTLKKVKKRVKITYKEILLFFLYLVFLYIFVTSTFSSLNFLLIVSILFFSSLIANLYRAEIKKSFLHKVDVEKAMEEVFAGEYAEEKEKEVLGNVKVIGEKEIEKLKKAKIKRVTIYKMFPFSPFLLAGFILALFFSSSIIII